MLFCALCLFPPLQWLGRYRRFLLFFFTAGLWGLAWLYDLPRIHRYVEQSKAQQRQLKTPSHPPSSTLTASPSPAPPSSSPSPPHPRVIRQVVQVTTSTFLPAAPVPHPPTVEKPSLPSNDPFTTDAAAGESGATGGAAEDEGTGPGSGAVKVTSAEVPFASAGEPIKAESNRLSHQPQREGEVQQPSPLTLSTGPAHIQSAERKAELPVASGSGPPPDSSPAIPPAATASGHLPHATPRKADEDGGDKSQGKQALLSATGAATSSASAPISAAVSSHAPHVSCSAPSGDSGGSSSSSTSPSLPSTPLVPPSPTSGQKMKSSITGGRAGGEGQWGREGGESSGGGSGHREGQQEQGQGGGQGEVGRGRRNRRGGGRR